MLVDAPAGLHSGIIGLLDLFWGCDGARLLLTHFFSHFKVQRVTLLSFSQENSSNAAGSGSHYREKQKKKLNRFYWFDLYSLHRPLAVTHREDLLFG